MRNIRGDLGLVGIENLLQMLSSAKCEGNLSILQENRKKVLHIGPQGIRLVSGARRLHPLGEILVRSGKITRERLDELLEEQRRTGKRLGDLVAGGGILSQEEIDHALREQVAEEIYELFSWKGAVFNFTEGGFTPVPGNPLSEITLDSDVMFVILEAGRRADEMMKIATLIPDERMIPVPLELPTAAEGLEVDPRVMKSVFPLMDGATPVDQILAKSIYPRFAVLRTLYGMVLAGLVKICRAEELGEPPKTVLSRPVPPGPGEGGPGRRVVLLGPAVPFRSASAAFLREAGYAVAEEEIAEGLEKLGSGPAADAVVLDAAVESPEGREACRRLREAGVSFLVLTPGTGPEALEQAAASGARFVLVKPVRPDRLLDRVSAALRPREPAEGPRPSS